MDTLPLNMDTLALIAALDALVVIGAIWYSLTERKDMSSRAKAVADHRDNLVDAMRKAPKSASPRSRLMAGSQQKSVSFMRTVVQKLRLLGTKEADKMQQQLTLAGYRSKDALVVFLFLKFILPLTFGALAAFVFYGLNLGDLSTPMKALLACGAAISGILVPSLYLGHTIKNRQKLLQRALPDALDLMVICTEAGLSLDATLDRAANEMLIGSPEMAAELGITAAELGFLPDRAQALSNLEARTDMPAIRGVVNTLKQTERYGTPLAQALRILSKEYREERMLKAEEKAAQLPATLTVPLIVFILPSLFVVLLGPAIIQAMDSLSGVF